MIKKTKYYSHKTGKLAKGCELCVKGKKSVLFSTGICPRDCFFCPISSQKKNNDVTYINELKIDELDLNGLLTETKLSGSKGVGITGGDPLSKINRTCGFIKILKKEFGKNFHIHLYTSFNLVNEESLKKLYNAGLDEIRFHPDLDNQNNWSNIKYAAKYDWDVGIEVPAFPDKEKELFQLMDFFKDKVMFFNLNEFEMSDNHIDNFIGKYKATEDNSYAIQGSMEVGKKILDYCNKNKINCHLCSVKLKDKVQLSKRIKIRAKNSKLKTDKIIEDSMLKRGVIYSAMIPGIKYEEEIKGMSKIDIAKEMQELKKLQNRLISINKIPEEKLFLDGEKLRILTSEKIVRKINKIIPERCAIVIEYPTSDQLTIEVDLLEK